MRNLKRALSLALASVMLLGMMVVGTSAASTNFPDDADIVNKEAAAITAGLGIFAGKTVEGGETAFDPTAVVRRSEMAAIIVKMLYGSDYNADTFKGTGKFTDVADFEGGWAEGYINLCASMGIVSGYAGTTEFRPGNPVTTAEAATMIINALGIDAGEGQWPITVMVKAEELKLFGDLKLKTNEGLTRDDLSVLVYEGLTYTPDGETCYDVTDGTNTYTFKSLDDAILYKALLGASYSVSAPYSSIEGSLADSVFGLKTANGIVTNNGALADIDYTTVGSANYKYATGLDLVGHNVTVYYKDAATQPTAGYTTYAVIDNSKTFAVTTSTTAAQLKAAVGADVTYNYTKYDGRYAPTDNVTTNLITTDATGTAIIYNKAIIGFVEPTAYTLDKVTDITTGTSAKIKLNNGGSEASLNNNATTDVVVEYDGIKKDDFVVYYKTGAIYHLEKAQTLTGTPTKINGNKLTIGGTVYDLVVDANKAGLSAVAPSFTANSVLYLAPNNKYFVAVGEDAGTPKTDVVYLNYVYSVTEYEADNYGTTNPVTTYWAQCVDMEGNEVIYQIKKALWMSDRAVGGLRKVSTAVSEDAGNGNLKAAYASFSTDTSMQAPTSITLTADAVKIVDNHYFTSDVKFIYVNGNKADMKVTVKDGVQPLTTKPVEYVAAGTSTNKTVSTVIVEAAYVAGSSAVDGTDILYVKASTTNSGKVPYTDANGDIQEAYEYSVYIDGVKTTIAATNSTLSEGFKLYTIENGVYTIGEANTAANLKTNANVTNMYNGLLSTDGGIEDMDVTGVTVVNTTTNTKVPTDATKLNNKDDVVLVLSTDLKSIELIYVVASTRS